MNENQKYIEEDEIDLRELFKTIAKNKKFIFIFTAVVTIFAIIYAFVKTPVYEAKAVVKIGTYIDNNSNKEIEDTGKLAAELKVLFIKLLKNVKDKDAEIKQISSMKKQKSFIEIISNSTSNDLAVKEIEKIIEYTQNKHQKIINEVLAKKKAELTSVERSIKFLKTNKLVSIDEEFSYKKDVEIPYIKENLKNAKENLKKYSDQLKLTEENLNKLKNENSSLAAINIMEKRNLEVVLNQLESDMLGQGLKLKNIVLNEIPRIKRKKDNVISSELQALLEKKEILKTSMLPHNYKNTEVIGKIMINDYPLKPKKKLIVAVAFVTGLILSIFLVFFIEFIKSTKEGKTEDE